MRIELPGAAVAAGFRYDAQGHVRMLGQAPAGFSQAQTQEKRPRSAVESLEKGILQPPPGSWPGRDEFGHADGLPKMGPGIIENHPSSQDDLPRDSRSKNASEPSPETQRYRHSARRFRPPSHLHLVRKQDVCYVTGMAKNTAVQSHPNPAMSRDKADVYLCGGYCTRFCELDYQTAINWSRSRRVVGKAQVNSKLENSRFKVCNQYTGGRPGSKLLKQHSLIRILKHAEPDVSQPERIDDDRD